MTEERHDQHHGSQTRHPAIHAETEHMSRWFSRLKLVKEPGDADERWPMAHCFVAGMAGATIADAKRHMRAHPSEPDPYYRRYAAAAETVTASLPPRLAWLWRAHYLEEQPLPACAEMAGREMDDALRDYRDLLLELHRRVPAALEAAKSEEGCAIVAARETSAGSASPSAA